MKPYDGRKMKTKMVFGRVEILTLLLFFWFQLRRARLRHASRRRVVCWWVVVLTFQLLNWGWLLAIAAFRSSRVIDTATVYVYFVSWY